MALSIDRLHPQPPKSMTLREAIALGTRQLAAAPRLSAHAAHDAELLLLHQLGLSRAGFRAHPERAFAPHEQVAYQAAITRRLNNEPIQYITGQQEFFGLLLHVTPAVLIPRPETEHLVEAVLDRLPKDQPLRILDIGTGSGAIALALATHLPQARITAADISPAALAAAHRNAESHRLTGRIRFVASDLLTGLADECFDAIVSNPPYVSETDRPILHPQVRDHEPANALYAGPDGLEVYRRLIPSARAALVPGGLLALEIGHGQQAAIVQLLGDWEQVTFVHDLQAIPRVALARQTS